MSESICSGFVGKNSSEATGTHSTEGVPSTINEGALSVDDHEHVSGIVASAERYLMAWRQVVTDRHNSDILYETIRESYSRESWTTLGYQTFGAFCRDRLGVGENELSDILISRFGMKRFRLLTVSARQQGRRNDLERTSRSDCGKFDLRMDTTVRTTLVAIERAPELECLVTSDLLPWALGAKLGSDDLSETQINKVKQLGAQVAELMAVPVAEAKRRIILGTFVLSSGYYDAYYEKAQRVRTLVKRDFDEAFKEVDVLLTPVAPTPAFKIGEKIDDPLAMYLCDMFTIPLKLGGFPAVSIPSKPLSALAPGELPIGFQLIGKKWHEADILGIGQFYEQLR